MKLVVFKTAKLDVAAYAFSVPYLLDVLDVQTVVVVMNSQLHRVILY